MALRHPLEHNESFEGSTPGEAGGLNDFAHGHFWQVLGCNTLKRLLAQSWNIESCRYWGVNQHLTTHSLHPVAPRPTRQLRKSISNPRITFFGVRQGDISDFSDCETARGQGRFDNC